MKVRKLWDGGRAVFPIVGAVVAVSMLPSCGSSTGPTPTPSPTPTPVPPIVETVVAGGSGRVPVLNLALIPFTTSATGRLEVTVDWTFATNDVDVYLMRGACSFDQFVANQCNLVTFSESATAKPERLTATGATAGSYVVGIGNLGPADESVAFQVVLTTGGANSASAGSRAGQAARNRGYARGIAIDPR